MLEYLKNETNRTYTENGAVTHMTTYSDCLDLFATIGALRSRSEQEILNRFVRAFTEDPDLAMKTLFFARDVRGGLGERKVFRVCLQWLAQNKPASAKKNIPYIAEYGRWDDLLSLIGTPCEKDALLVIKQQLEADLNAMDMGDDVSLLAKWLPSVNASNTQTVLYAKRIARYLGMSDAQYRKTLVKLRERIRIFENNLRVKDYSFDYSKQPSKAMFMYRKAFYRNDGERYEAFLSKVSRGEAQLHTGTLTPYEIIKPFFYESLSDQEANTIDATWRAQEDFTGDENALVVIDGSGSMYCRTDPMPATVALSLGIYFAERNTGPYHNMFMSFSGSSSIQVLRGETLAQKINSINMNDWENNTNLQAAFKHILDIAIRNHVSPEDMPKSLIVISDMEIDYCGDRQWTFYEMMEKAFRRYGYQIPNIVFRNVASRHDVFHADKKRKGVQLVSGQSASVFRQVMQTVGMNPVEAMEKIINSERYEAITVERTAG